MAEVSTMTVDEVVSYFLEGDAFPSDHWAKLSSWNLTLRGLRERRPLREPRSRGQLARARRRRGSPRAGRRAHVCRELEVGELN